jgi:hypothetical protein
VATGPVVGAVGRTGSRELGTDAVGDLDACRRGEKDDREEAAPHGGWV